MSRVDPDKLMMFALYVLEEMIGQAKGNTERTMKRTWAIRLALAYLHQRGIADAMACSNIWHGLVDTGTEGSTDMIHAYCRHRDLNAYVAAIFRSAGIPRFREGRPPEIADGPFKRRLIPVLEKHVSHGPLPPAPIDKPMTPEEWQAFQAAREATRGNSIQTSHPRNKRTKGTTVGNGSRNS